MRPDTEYAMSPSLVAGAVAGSASKTLTAPLSRATILQQVGSHTKLAAVWAEYRRCGLLSMWRGNALSVVHKMPFCAINYYTYEVAKVGLQRYWTAEDNPGALVRFAAGLCSGGTAVAVTYPIDMLRTRKAASIDKSTFEVAKGLRQEGFFALWGGLRTSIACQSVNLALNFTLYESLLAKCLRGTAQERGSLPTSLGCGAVAGMIASSLIHPLDLLRRRQQVARTPESVFALAPRIVREEGLRALYRGLPTELCKVAPAVGLNFYFYELVRREMMRGHYSPR